MGVSVEEVEGGEEVEEEVEEEEVEAVDVLEVIINGVNHTFKTKINLITLKGKMMGIKGRIQPVLLKIRISPLFSRTSRNDSHRLKNILLYGLFQTDFLTLDTPKVSQGSTSLISCFSTRFSLMT